MSAVVVNMHWLLGRLDRVRETNTGWMACCPAHDDRNPSLSLAVTNDGVILLHCFAGCQLRAICEELGISESDLFPDDGLYVHSRNGTGRHDRTSFHKGGIIFDAPEHVPAIWGRGHAVLWSEGEPLIIAGPPSVGKTTLAQQLALARCGITGDVLGLPVAASASRTLYIAADRPQQALRSMRRMVTPDQRERLDDALAIQSGPFDALSDPAQVVALLRGEAIGTVIFDSVKDVAGDVSEGKVGAAFNQTLQLLLAEGIEVAALHHPRKGQQGNRRPKRLDDLYGSTWLAAGAGSVVYLYGEAGDREVEMLHLKQPDNVVGPLKVIHDHATGISTVASGAEMAELRERFRQACIAALTEEEPLGRNRLIERAKEHGVQGRTETLRDLLSDLADEDDSGLDSTPKGYVLSYGPDGPGHSGATPPPGYGPTVRPVRGDGAAPGPPGPGHPSADDYRIEPL